MKIAKYAGAIGAAAIAATMFPLIAFGQMPRRPDVPPLLVSANPVVQNHINAAQRAAATRWADQFPALCSLATPNRPYAMPVRDKPATMPEAPNWPAAPAKVFDNLYFVGSKAVSAFAIDTAEGIIITDAMWSYDAALSIVGGLRTLGLDPNRIRYVIIPHGHPDHYGGAQFLHDNFGAKIVAPKGDLDLIAHGPSYDTTPIPKGFDLLVGDGDTLTLGGITIRFSVMPGHTPGGIVMDFPVTDFGIPHHALIWAAGGATPGSTEGQTAQAAALRRLMARAKAERFDVLADNHGSHNLVEMMKSGSARANPFLVGNDGVTGYLEMRSQCDLARAANAKE